MTLKPVKAGDPLSKRAQNLLIGEVNRNSGLTDDLSFASVFYNPTIATFSWWELTAALTYPADKTDTPYTDDAKQVSYVPYTGHDEAHTVGKNRLYAPGALRDSDGDYIGLPLGRSGLRVGAVLNLQSGHWEIVTPIQMAWRGKLDETLEQGGSATVSIWQYTDSDADSTVNVTAHDWFLDTGEELAAGTKVKVEWFPDDAGRLYVTGAAC